MNANIQKTQAEVQRILAAHPGVKETIVMASPTSDGTDTLVAYVVPNEQTIESLMDVAAEEHGRTRKWRAVFDLMQKSKSAGSAQPGFNVVSWNSSYTRKPIPSEEMQEWVSCTVDQILALRPRNVLEIGCGTGLLLLRVAPHCIRYIGADFSETSLKRLKEQMEQMPGPWNAVTLHERAADNFEGFEPDSFDTVIINSVVQYFPNLQYLVRVLENAVKVTRPGGTIFVGDVRNFQLLEAFAVSVELYQAQPDLSLSDLRKRVRRRIDQQEELVISPQFFLAFQQRSAKMSSVAISPKLGQFDNEMNRFRYDVILRLAPHQEQMAEIKWLEWSELEYSLDSIAKILRVEQPDALGIRDIRNARVAKDVEAVLALSSSESTASVAELRQALSKTPVCGILPQQLRALAHSLEYEASLSWAQASGNGSFDAILRRTGSKSPGAGTTTNWPKPLPLSDDLTIYANDPSRVARRRKLISDLQEYLMRELPANSETPSIVLLEGIPRSLDGQVEVQSLPRA